jgi:hypothetical protein
LGFINEASDRDLEMEQEAKEPIIYGVVDDLFFGANSTPGETSKVSAQKTPSQEALLVPCAHVGAHSRGPFGIRM